MTNHLYNQYSRRKIYIVRHILTVRFPFTYLHTRPEILCCAAACNYFLCTFLLRMPVCHKT